ncbi:hypothetical protein B0J17DRAFT_628153 [Rhizoctonia solani]|nr:hypothetical protein B0J17DRAFT_628153 [Rhizoctonia solani]
MSTMKAIWLGRRLVDREVVFDSGTKQSEALLGSKREKRLGLVARLGGLRNGTNTLDAFDNFVRDFFLEVPWAPEGDPWALNGWPVGDTRVGRLAYENYGRSVVSAKTTQCDASVPSVFAKTQGNAPGRSRTIAQGTPLKDGPPKPDSTESTQFQPDTCRQSRHLIKPITQSEDVTVREHCDPTCSLLEQKIEEDNLDDGRQGVVNGDEYCSYYTAEQTKNKSGPNDFAPRPSLIKALFGSEMHHNSTTPPPASPIPPPPSELDDFSESSSDGNLSPISISSSFSGSYHSNYSAPATPTSSGRTFQEAPAHDLQTPLASPPKADLEDLSGPRVELFDTSAVFDALEDVRVCGGARLNLARAASCDYYANGEYMIIYEDTSADDVFGEEVTLSDPETESNQFTNDSLGDIYRLLGEYAI